MASRSPHECREPLAGPPHVPPLHRAARASGLSVGRFARGCRESPPHSCRCGLRVRRPAKPPHEPGRRAAPACRDAAGRRDCLPGEATGPGSRAQDGPLEGAAGFQAAWAGMPRARGEAAVSRLPDRRWWQGRRGRAAVARQRADQVGPVAVGQAEIDDHHVGAVERQVARGGLQRVGPAQARARALAEQPQRLGGEAAVFDRKNGDAVQRQQAAGGDWFQDAARAVGSGIGGPFRDRALRRWAARSQCNRSSFASGKPRSPLRRRAPCPLPRPRRITGRIQTTEPCHDRTPEPCRHRRARS